MEYKILLAYIAFGGMAFTSFGMLVGYRWKSEMSTKLYLKSIAVESSRCDHCGKKINLLQCFPIIGWLFYKGKHSCGKKVSPVYPISEILGGIFTFTVAYQHGIEAGFWSLPFIAGISAAIVSDLAENEIHGFMALMIAFGAAGYSYASGHLLEGIYTSIAITGLFLAMSILFVIIGRMPIVPYGDVALIAAIGLSLNVDKGLVFFISLAIITIVGKKVLEKYSKQGDEIKGAFPLGPPLCLAACIAMIT